MFCKLFESERHGQILVRYEEERRPEVVISFEGDGTIATLRVGFPDTNKGAKAADDALRKITKEEAEAVVQKAKDEYELIGDAEVE